MDRRYIEERSRRKLRFMVDARRIFWRNHPMFRIAPADLDEIVRRGARDFEALRGARIFITGGTGFFGKWLLAGLAEAGRELGLGLRLTILSRDPERFAAGWPEVKEQRGWNLFEGHVAELPALLERFDYVVHAAADAPAQPDEVAEAERSRAIVAGTERVLALAERPGTKRLLFVSTGAIYGAATGKLEGASENESINAQALMPYAEAKRVAEAACARSETAYNIARAFAFLGPHLPLDQNFAAGNFIGDALRGGPVRVRGDGTALRSYLYPTDLVVWLLAILTRGRLGAAYNVGSDEVVSTRDLARAIAAHAGEDVRVEIQATQPQGPQNIYLPNIARAQEELGLSVTVPLREAIRRTLAFYRAR
jgi:nucleoside-diphosphate-sugar epimerase